MGNWRSATAERVCSGSSWPEHSNARAESLRKMTTSSPTLLVTADDRTGLLEAGGACADLGFRVRFGATPIAGDDCALLDIASRHRLPREAAARAVAAHRHPARFRCHKMDSGLRGNWAHEIAALLETNRRIGVLPSFPDAGRRCVNGTVLIHDVPVAETAFGRDPRNRVTSSRPVDYLRAAGCGAALRRGDLRVLDAGDNAELAAAAARCLDEGRMPVGSTGGIAAYAAVLRTPEPVAPPVLPRPALTLCGSLHPVSRGQIAALPGPVHGPEDGETIVEELRGGADVVVATPLVTGAIHHAQADAMAARLAAGAWKWLDAGRAKALIILGGDTAAAVLGDRPLDVVGSVDTGVPLCLAGADRRAVLTKGGGIGREDTLLKLLFSKMG